MFVGFVRGLVQKSQRQRTDSSLMKLTRSDVSVVLELAAATTNENRLLNQLLTKCGLKATPALSSLPRH